MATKTRGAPYPLGSDANNTAADLSALAQWVDDRPGVAALTTTARNALSGVDRWDGKLVLDTTLDRLFRWDAGTTTWIQLSDFSEIAALLATSGTPAADGTASRGVSTFAARADHVHPVPTWQTWTPTITAESGAFSSASAIYARYLVTGKLLELAIQIDINNAGTATGAVRFTLPITPPVGSGVRILPGRENFATGAQLQCIVNANVAYGTVYRYDGASIIAAPRAVLISGAYEIA